MTQVIAPNRRAAVRRQPALGTVCHLDGSSELGLVWNLSLSGVSMLLHEPIAPHSRLSGKLATIDGNSSLPVDLHVVHLRQLRTGDYFVGAQFDQAVVMEQLQPFLADGKGALAPAT
jgi:hypothetical protein